MYFLQQFERVQIAQSSLKDLRPQSQQELQRDIKFHKKRRRASCQCSSCCKPIQLEYELLDSSYHGNSNEISQVDKIKDELVSSHEESSLLNILKPDTSPEISPIPQPIKKSVKTKESKQKFNINRKFHDSKPKQKSCSNINTNPFSNPVIKNEMLHQIRKEIQQEEEKKQAEKQAEKAKSRNKTKIKTHKTKPQFDINFDGLNELDLMDMEFLDQVVATQEYEHSSTSSGEDEDQDLQTIMEVKEDKKNKPKLKTRILPQAPPVLTQMLNDVKKRTLRLDKILEQKPSPERIKKIKKLLKRNRRRMRKLRNKRNKSKKNNKDHEEPFLPQVGVNTKKSKSKHKGKSKQSKTHRSKGKDFESFKFASAYGQFMANQNTKTKFRSTYYSNTRTDYTTPSFPMCTARGVVPSPIGLELNSEAFKTKSSLNFMSPGKDAPLSTRNDVHYSKEKIESMERSQKCFKHVKSNKKLQLYLPGLNNRNGSPRKFSKLNLNSLKDYLPHLK
ncbi:unnamed protein product [Moneuplotes crassus]|uniref:Uncharacterized protein n=1 Tax=Euplotes crassus TaxID=5936 RepID=A0AAD1X7Y6_EUPCR|nr:unnamed protein product [Moneuplotes crassus]